MVDGDGEALRQRGIAVVVQPGFGFRGAQQLGGVQRRGHERASAQLQQFVFGCADVCSRGLGVPQTGHGAVIEDLGHAQTRIHIRLDDLGDLLRRAVRYDGEEHLGLRLVQECDDPLAGEHRRVDVLKSAPIVAHRMLKPEAAQRLRGHLQQKGLDQGRLQDLGEGVLVLADQTHLDETRCDRQRIAAGALGGCPYRGEHLGVMLRSPGAGRPPPVGVAAGDVEHPRAAGADPDLR